MDGHVAAEPGVYDFSIYVDEADQATIQRAQEKLMQLADVNAAVQQGMTLLYGWTDYVGGHVCPVFALGSMDGEPMMTPSSSAAPRRTYGELGERDGLRKLYFWEGVCSS